MSENISPESVEHSIEEKKEEKVEIQSVIIAVPSEIDFDKLAKEGLDVLIEKYLDDGVIDNEELVDLVKYTMEIVERKKEISGQEKKRLVLLILRKFIQDKVKDYDNLEKLFDKAIDLCVKVSKDGLETIKFSSETITDTKNAFNLIYSNTMSKIDEKYPIADDIVNNLFDITLYIVQIIEGQTKLNDIEKKVLLKKIIIKVINSLDSKLSKDQQSFLISQIEPTLSLVQIGIRAERGEFQINIAEVTGICVCFRRLFKK